MKRKTDFTEKPYNRCLSCPHRKIRCDGPRTSGLPLKRWCEYMRDMKEINGLTNAEIAEEAGVSVKTIERIMAMNDDQDIMRETARRIENAILGPCGQSPCALAYEEEHSLEGKKLDDALRELERVHIDNKEYRDALDSIHSSYKSEMETIRAEAQKKIDFLVEQVAKLRADNDNLWAENNRKSRIVDTFLANGGFALLGNKNNT